MNWFKKNKCPITEEDKDWLEESFLWFEGILGKDFILNRETILPTKQYFNWDYQSKEGDAQKVLEVISKLMEVDPKRINLCFYSEVGNVEFTEGIITRNIDKLTAGKYVEFADGNIEIWIEEKQLKDPVSLIATMAHELAHVKLLGDNLIEENDEYLTDLAVIIFGFGIFSANTALVRMNTWSGLTHTGWQIAGGDGYLHFKVQSFALALLANYRNDLNTDWTEFLDKEIRKLFFKSLKYIQGDIDHIKFK